MFICSLGVMASSSHSHDVFVRCPESLPPHPPTTPVRKPTDISQIVELFFQIHKYELFHMLAFWSADTVLCHLCHVRPLIAFCLWYFTSRQLNSLPQWMLGNPVWYNLWRRDPENDVHPLFWMWTIIKCDLLLVCSQHYLLHSICVWSDFVSSCSL